MATALDGARLFHLNVNCSDLERSRRFYTDGLGLEIGAHTAPQTTQPGTAFGLDRARWDASILLGPRGYEGGAVDLLEWHEPNPVGSPPAAINETGWQRLGIRVPDLDQAIAAVAPFGGATWSEPVIHTLGSGQEIRIVLGNDPDGTALELVEGGETSVSFVGVTCADLDLARDFYAALGLREVARFPSENDDGTHLRIDGPVAMDEVAMVAPAGEVLMMLVGFRRPAPKAAPARPANALGIWRAAFVVADLDAAVAELARLHIQTISPPVEMDMGPGLPMLRFVCFRGPNGEALELIEQPQA